MRIRSSDDSSSFGKLILPEVGIGRGWGLRPVLVTWLVWWLLPADGRVGAQSIMFDFDAGLPTLLENVLLPLDQNAGGVTAHLESPNGSFYVTTPAKWQWHMSNMTNHFLYPVTQATTNLILEIKFSENLTNISFQYETYQIPPIENPTAIRLEAYSNSVNGALIGWTTNKGVYGGPSGLDTFPVGSVTYNSTKPFNVVRIWIPNEVPPDPTGQAYEFLIDSIAVQRAGGPSCTITVTNSLPGAGTVTGSGGYTVGQTVNLFATPSVGYVFTGWSEDGNAVTNISSLSFGAVTNRSLTANFVPASFYVKISSQPVSGGGSIIPPNSTGSGYALPAGTNLTLAAMPGPNYIFTSWKYGSGLNVTNLLSTQPNCAFVVRSNLTVVAYFSAIAAKVSTNVFGPKLGISAAPTNLVQLSWLADSNGYHLLTSSLPAGAPWYEVTNGVLTASNFNQVVLPVTSNGFFQLYQP